MIASSGPAPELAREDLAAIEQPPAEQLKQRPVVLCSDYLRAVHPDTGLDVVFVPGEALPDWAAETQTTRQTPAPPPAPAGKGPAKSRKATAEAESIDLA